MRPEDCRIANRSPGKGRARVTCRRAGSLLPVFVFGSVFAALLAVGCGQSMPRAFEQQARADLLMHFYSWDDFTLLRPEVLVQGRIRVETPEGGSTLVPHPAPSSRMTFVNDLRDYAGRRNLAVVVFDKRLSVEPAQREAAMADLENILKHFGFQYISFQQDQSVLIEGGLPILREG